MAIKTTAAQLEEVQVAISKVLMGQSGTWNGRTVTYASLPALTAREETLERRLRVEQGRPLVAMNRGVLHRD